MPSYFVPPTLHGARSVNDIQHPVHEFRVPCVLHIESPSLATILFVGDPNGARNDGPVPSLYHTRYQVAAGVTFAALEWRLPGRPAQCISALRAGSVPGLLLSFLPPSQRHRVLSSWEA